MQRKTLSHYKLSRMATVLFLFVLSRRATVRTPIASHFASYASLTARPSGVASFILHLVILISLINIRKFDNKRGETKKKFFRRARVRSRLRYLIRVLVPLRHLEPLIITRRRDNVRSGVI